MQYSLSPTTLNLLEECPRCFWLQLVKKRPRPKLPLPGIVNRIDGVLKKYCDSFRIKGELPPLWGNQVPGKLATIPRNYKYADEKTGVIVTGKLDEVLEIKTRVFAPLDHKTKGKSPEEIHKTHQLQMDVYTYLLEHGGFKTTRTAYLAYYWPEEGMLHHGFKMGVKVMRVKTNPGRIQKLLLKAKSVLENKIPSKNKVCIFCAWRS